MIDLREIANMYVGDKPVKQIWLGNKLIRDFTPVVIEPPIEPPVNSPTTFKQAGFPFGIMTKTGTLNKLQNRDLILNEAVAISPENDFKGTVKSYDPVTGNYTTDYSDTDPQVIWAKANNIKVHVHNGIWLGKEDRWITDNDPNRPTPNALIYNPNMTTQKWWDLLKIIIQAPLLHHKNNPALDNVIDSYDVINEPFRESADYNNTKQVFKNSIFIQKLGVGCLKQAMIWAREADPRIKLFINEYGFEYGGYKVDNMIKTVNAWKAEGVPFDGWGLQYHQDCRISSTQTSATRKNMILLAATVDHIHLSEVALKLNYSPFKQSGVPFVYTPEMELLQAQKYLALSRYFRLDIPKSKQYRFTTWGGIDDDYMGNGEQEFAMLFKNDYTPKLAHKYILDDVIATG